MGSSQAIPLVAFGEPIYKQLETSKTLAHVFVKFAPSVYMLQSNSTDTLKSMGMLVKRRERVCRFKEQSQTLLHILHDRHCFKCFTLVNSSNLRTSKDLEDHVSPAPHYYFNLLHGFVMGIYMPH